MRARLCIRRYNPNSTNNWTCPRFLGLDPPVAPACTFMVIVSPSSCILGAKICTNTFLLTSNNYSDTNVYRKFITSSSRIFGEQKILACSDRPRRARTNQAQPVKGLRFFLVVPMRKELEAALDLAKSLPAEELPAFLGEVERIRITALARVVSPAAQTPADSLLEVPEAAARLSVSPDYLYRHSKKFPFTRRLGRALRFSSSGIDTYLKRARA